MISGKELKAKVAQAAKEWLEEAERRRKAGTHGPGLIQTIPGEGLMMIFGHALLKESTALKWLTVVLAILTAVLLGRTFI